jgi:hypothetical protein
MRSACTVVLTITDEATERGLTSLRCMSPVVSRFSDAGMTRRGRCDSPHQGAGPQMILAALDHALHADNT